VCLFSYLFFVFFFFVGKGPRSILYKGETTAVLFNLTDASALTVANIQIELVPLQLVPSVSSGPDHFMKVEANASVRSNSMAIVFPLDRIPIKEMSPQTEDGVCWRAARALTTT
jgi:hypothetical protein